MRSSGAHIEVAVRKRAQIASENKTMFICVAIVSAIVGFAVVASIFLVQLILFNEKVLQAKEQTVSNLKANNAVASDLKDKIRALDANEALISAKANSSDETLQVVLDALPSTANSLALGASLQNKLLNVAGVTLESLQVTPSSSEASPDSTSGSTISDNAISDSNAIAFTFTVTGKSSDLKAVLANLEKSIRTIDVVSLKIDSQSNDQESMTVQALAFYEPAVDLKLTDKVIK